MTKINYIPLHVHSDRSLMDGSATPLDYALRGVELGMPAIAVTDHGSMSVHREWETTMRKHNIKPIYGIEAYVTHDINDRRAAKDRHEPLDKIYRHLTIIAKDVQGYKNLSLLNEIAWSTGHFHKPRMDFDMIDKHRDGLILGSACMGGLLNSAIEQGEIAVAKEHIATLRDIAGDDFYIEVMPHNNTSTDVVGINAALIALADEFKVKTIVTPDCHHAHDGQKVIQEIMLISSTYPKVLTDKEKAQKEEQEQATIDAGGVVRRPDYSMLDANDAYYMRALDDIYGHDRRMTFNKFDIHLLSGEEMWRGMGDDARMDSFDNTFEVSEKVEDIELPRNLDLLPVLYDDHDAELERRCRESIVINESNEDQLKEELAVVKELGFAAYFLIVEDVVNWAKQQGITVGPGRGSGAGSLINYALGITGVDPVKHHLIFSRFLDVSRRGEWPDIDVDFEDSRRDEVKAYIAEKYGNVASIATFQKFNGKGIVKDVARAFMIPLSEVNRVSKLIDTWEEYKTSSSVEWFRIKYPMIERYGDQIMGRVRGTGVHASGMIASRVPLAGIVPVETRAVAGSDRQPVIAVDMDETADIGLIKLDILGLKALSTLKDTIRLIKDRHGLDIDLYKIPMDDAGVYEMLSAGHTAGIFQYEQAPLTKLLINMGVGNFDELSAANALVRPGAANTVGKEYIKRKLGRSKVTYIHECMRPYTESSLGLIIYQEQIMRLCTELAGMTMVEANQVRRSTSKKKDPEELAIFKERFVSGASEKVSKEEADALWENILEWSGYGFNLAHSVAYSYIGYWTAWFKYHYPLEFMVATLANEKDRDSRTRYLIDAKRMRIDVRLPHINRSEIYTSIEGDAIRMGLSDIKYVSPKTAQRYIDARPFRTNADVESFTFTKGSGVTRSQLSAMALVGALPDKMEDPEAVKPYLYEYLNLPELAISIPGHWPALMTTANAFDDKGAHIMMGIVTDVRRGDGWSLISVMDKTGTFGVFDSEDSIIVKGQSYLFLIGANRIASAVPLSDGIPKNNGLVWWMDQLEVCAPNERFVLSFSRRKTKRGENMGTLIVSTHDKDIYPVTVFSSMFPVAHAKLTPGTSHRMICEEGRDGGMILKSVE